MEKLKKHDFSLFGETDLKIPPVLHQPLRQFKKRSDFQLLMRVAEGALSHCTVHNMVRKPKKASGPAQCSIFVQNLGVLGPFL